MKQGVIEKVSGPLVVARGLDDAKMYDVVMVSGHRLVGEVIELRGNKASIQVYEEILDIDPEHEEALYELARLQAHNEDWTSAHDTLRRLTEIIDDPDQKIDLYYRLGVIDEEKLKNFKVSLENVQNWEDAPQVVEEINKYAKVLEEL